MTKVEFLKYVEENNIDMERYNFYVGEKTNIPFSTGCFEEEGQWKVYGVDERQSFAVIKQGDEESVFQYMYHLLRGAMKR